MNKITRMLKCVEGLKWRKKGGRKKGEEIFLRDKIHSVESDENANDSRHAI